MEYEIKDEYGNMICTIENTDEEIGEESVRKVFAGINRGLGILVIPKAITLGIARGNVLALPMTIINALYSPAVGTLISHITAIGKYDSGEEMMDSTRFKGIVKSKIKSKYNEFPSLEEVKTSKKTKNKTTFLQEFFGNISDDKVKDNIGSTSMKLKVIEGVPCAVIKLTPIAGTVDLKQLAGYKLMVGTAFVKKHNRIKSIPLCHGYLTKDNLVNMSGEAYVIDTSCVDDIYFK